MLEDVADVAVADVVVDDGEGLAAGGDGGQAAGGGVEIEAGGVDGPQDAADLLQEEGERVGAPSPPGPVWCGGWQLLLSNWVLGSCPAMEQE